MKEAARLLLNLPRRCKRWWARLALRRLVRCSKSMPIDVRLARWMYLGKRLIQRTVRRGTTILSPTSVDLSVAAFNDQFWIKLDQLSHLDGKPEDRLYASFSANQQLSKAEWSAMRHAVDAMDAPPLVSIITPTYNSTPAWLERLWRTISEQAYDRWEWIIVDDGSVSNATVAALDRLAFEDDRIVIERFSTNQGVVAATNRAVELACGNLLAFVDHDDEILPDSLWYIVGKFQSNESFDAVYTDEEMVPEGRPPYPHFKPDFSPENLAAFNGICHLLVVRASAFHAAGGFRAGTEGAQDYDLVLRLSRNGCRFGHVPRVLYRWRLIPMSLSRIRDAKSGWVRQNDRIGQLTSRIVQEHLDAIGIPAQANLVDDWIRPRCPPIDHGMATIIVCTRDRPELLDLCVKSIETKTDYPNYELIVVDNGSKLPETRRLLQHIGTRHHVVTMHSGPEGFNFARLNNDAAKLAHGDYLVFLNNDTEVVDSGWLSGLVGWLQCRDIGAVGARLLFSDRRIQHAGVIVGAMDWGPWHALRDLPGDTNAFHGYLRLVHNNLAVTGACLATRKSTFDAVGGFDESAFAVCFNDVDYCLRLHKSGLRTVFAPQAELLHHESRTRPPVTNPMEALNFKIRYCGIGDPFWNPNYSRESLHFEVRTRRYARRIVKLRPRILAIAPGRSTIHQTSLANLLAATARRADLDFDIANVVPGQGTPHDRQEVNELLRTASLKETNVIVVDGLEHYTAVHQAIRRGFVCIWRLAGRVAFPKDWSPAQRVRCLQALRRPYQVVFDCRFHRLEAERGWPRDNFSVIDAIPLDWPACDDLTLQSAHARVRNLLGVDKSAIVVASSIESGSGIGDSTSQGVCNSHWKLSTVAGQGVDGAMVTTTDFDRLLPGCDLFVAEPIRHARSLATMRAMQCGLPVVGTRPVADADLLQPNVTGLEFREFDKSDREAKLRLLASDAALRKEYGDAGRIWIQSRRSAESVLDDWAELFVEAAELALTLPGMIRDTPLQESTKFLRRREKLSLRRA